MSSNRSSHHVRGAMAGLKALGAPAGGEQSGTRFGSVLTERQAVEIYRCKLELKMPRSFHDSLQTAESRMKGQSVPVAEMFGVSPKTIRDIWNRRTWAYATVSLWAEEDPSSVGGQDSAEIASLRARRGRPKGSRDSKPRLKKAERIDHIAANDSGFDSMWANRAEAYDYSGHQSHEFAHAHAGEHEQSQANRSTSTYFQGDESYFACPRPDFRAVASGQQHNYFSQPFVTERPESRQEHSYFSRQSQAPPPPARIIPAQPYGQQQNFGQASSMPSPSDLGSSSPAQGPAQYGLPCPPYIRHHSGQVHAAAAHAAAAPPLAGGVPQVRSDSDSTPAPPGDDPFHSDWPFW